MILRIAAIVILLSASVSAQNLPERYSVTGVDADDVLNIRSGPGASFDGIGALPPFSVSVEVLDQQNGWGMVSAGERNGWVSMRYLELFPLPADALPRPIQCSGTEPFWTIGFYPKGAEYTSLATDMRRDLTVVTEEVAPNGYFVETMEDGDVRRRLTIKAGFCSDGMSDRRFGMSALLFTQSPNGSDIQSGCCTFHGE